jgi:hypothetical protein
MFSTSDDAFSISSNNTTEYGFLLTDSVRFHHSSYHTYHAGEPISFDTEYFSINSDMSILIIAVSSPKYSLAINFARYVLPTQLGHKNKKDQIGLFF